ncbi:MAG: hypothetical protein ABJ215_06280 [Alphaproteobacteria bacterium]
MLPPEIESRIFKDLRTCALNYRHGAEGNPTWTTRIAHDICRHGEEAGYWAAALRFKPKYQRMNSIRNEWLFDAVWLKYIGENLVSIPLAMECEWGTDSEIDDDFQKLIVSRASLRVMVFGDRNLKNDTTAERLWLSAKLFEESAGDRYLLAGFENLEDGWTFYRFTVGEGLEKCDAFGHATSEPAQFRWNTIKN